MHHYQSKIIKALAMQGHIGYIINDKILSTAYTKNDKGIISVMQVSYTGLDNTRHTVTYVEEGPCGSRWFNNNGSLLTIDLVQLKDGSVLNPWDNAKDKSISWIIKE